MKSWLIPPPLCKPTHMVVKSSFWFITTLLLVGCSPPLARAAGYSIEGSQNGAMPKSESDNLQLDQQAGTPLNPSGRLVFNDNSQPQPTELSSQSAHFETSELPLFADRSMQNHLVEVSIQGSEQLPVELASPNGTWIAYCRPQLKKSSDPRSKFDVKRIEYLNLKGKTDSLPRASRPLLSIETVSPDGRYLVVTSVAGELLLLDSQQDTQKSLQSLFPDLRRDAETKHRSFAFDLHSGHLAILTEDRSVKFLELNTGTISTLERTSTRSIWRLEASGLGFILKTLPPGARAQSWPSKPSSRPAYRCKEPGQSFQFNSQLNSPKPLRRVEVERIVDVNGAYHSLSSPGFIQSFRKGWLRRTDDGELFFVEGVRQKRLTSSRCGGRILFASETSNRFLITCEEFRTTSAKKKKKRRAKPRYRFEVYFIAPGFVRDTGKEMARTHLDEIATEQRFTAIRAGREHLLADSKTLKLYPLKNTQVLSFLIEEPCCSKTKC